MNAGAGNLRRKARTFLPGFVFFFPFFLWCASGSGSSAEEFEAVLNLPSSRVDLYRAALLLAAGDGKSRLAEDLAYLDGLAASVFERTRPQDPEAYLKDAVDVVFGQEGFKRLDPPYTLCDLYFHRVLETRKGPDLALVLVLRAALRNVAFPVSVSREADDYFLYSGPPGGRYRVKVSTGELEVAPGTIIDGSGAVSVQSSDELTARGLLGRYSLLLGRAARREGKTREAVRFLRWSWHLAPRRADLYAELGFIALGKWRLARADRCFLRAQRLDASLLSALTGRAEVFVRRGQLGGAWSELQKVFALDHGNFAALMVQGEIFLAQQEYKAALDQFLRLTRRKPESAEAWADLALAYLGSGDRTGAERCIETALKLDPRCAVAYCARGQLLHKSEPELALAAYRKALECNPRYAPAYYWRGTFYQSRNLAEAAIKDYRAFLDIVSDHPWAGEINRRIELLRADLGSKPEDGGL